MQNTIQAKSKTIRTPQSLRAAGLATWKQKINLAKVNKDGKSVVPQSAFLGISRKLINLDRRDKPSFSRVIRTKEMQSFEVDLNRKNWLIAQSRPNGFWVMSDG